jgi:serine/threonine-protein kinase
MSMDASIVDGAILRSTVSIAARASTLIAGCWLDRYELLCPIATGGMAEAWVARLQGKFGFEKLVAIKTILPKFAADPRFQRMFLDEARIASRIEHTNVARTLDLGEERGVLYLVMEWVDGDGLNKLHRVLEKKGASLPSGILLRIIADVCGGLHAAHELRGSDGSPLRVVHRDVSPQNILISTRGEAKLIDFGVAKARDRVAGDTNAGVLKGKVRYMAPEQALGREVDRRADVWAVGALLYHLLTGRPPYEGANPLATLHLLASGDPPPPLPADVPDPIARVVLHALAHSREARPATAVEVQAAIERAMVAANVPTTIADVAQFVAVHLADRAAQRKRTIELALRAASERMRIQPLLELPRNDSIVDVLCAAAAEPSGGIELSLPAVARQTGGSREVAARAQDAVAARPSGPLPPGVAASAARNRRLFVAAMGAVACAVVTALMLASGPGSGPRTLRDPGEGPPLGASIRPPSAVPDNALGSAYTAPPIASSSAGPVVDAPAAAMAGSTTPIAAPHPLPSGPAPWHAHTNAAPKPPPTVTSIPEVIDNGF